MQLNPCLTFNGKCREAFALYQECLGGSIQTMMTWGDSPMKDNVPSEWHERIIHTTMIVGGTMLMGSDAPPDRYEEPRGFAVTANIDDPAEAERVFRELSEGGTVTMPIQQTFWATRFGMAVDRFGIPWMINCGQPA